MSFVGRELAWTRFAWGCQRRRAWSVRHCPGRAPYGSRNRSEQVL